MNKVHYLCLASVLLMQFTQLYSKLVEMKCPEFCKCDIFENLKRASCQHRRLVSMELNIPSQAEILDVSDNQISELKDKIFMEINLTDLKLLNLSYNKIREIHFNGFVGLDNLKSLDLSFNAIEYFTKSWFYSLKSLEELYLRGNKLRKINEEPPIEIASLKVLDISKCGITRLGKEPLKYLLNLQVLDISENFIQIIKVDILKTLPSLTTLKTNNNNFNCKDNNVIAFKNYAKSQKIVYTDSCEKEVETFFSINNVLHKFEKMKMLEEVTNTSPQPSRNSWIFNDRQIKEINNTYCNNSTNENIARNFDENSLLLEILLLCPWTALTIVFAYGILCGMVLACALNLCKKKRNSEVNIEIPDGSIHRNTRSVPNLAENLKSFRRTNSGIYTSLQKAKRRLSREILDDDCVDGETLVMNEIELSNSTPMPERKCII